MRLQQPSTKQRQRRLRPALLASVVVVSIALAAAPARAIPPDGPPDPDPCERPTPPPSCSAGTPTGTLTAVSRPPSGLLVSGTAKDPDAPGPVQVAVEVNGSYVGSVWTTGPAGEFSGPPVTPRAGSQVCVRAINRNEGDDAPLGCRQLEVRVDPFGHLDEVTTSAAGLRVRGWVIDPDTTAPTYVHVYVDGQLRQQTVSASADRPDVAAAYPQYGSAHGFDVTVPGSTRHTSVCVDAVNQGPGDLRRVGCGRDPHAVSVLTLNLQGTHEWFTNDYGDGESRIPWRERYGRVGRWMAGSGTLPDLIALQEVPARKQYWFPYPHTEPPDYESLFVLIDQINTRTGAQYRIAYLSPDYVGEGWQPLYQGRALIYNADRLRNTTTLVNSWAVAHDNKTTTGVHMRTSWPCHPPAEFASKCALIDSTSGADHEGRHWVSSFTDPTTKEWKRGPQAAVFELVADPDKHIIVINVHEASRCPEEPPKSKPCLASERESQLSLRTLVDQVSSAWRPRTKLIPPIVAGDFNGDPNMPTGDLGGDYEPTLPDFETTATESVDFVLGGKPSAYPSVYAPATVGDWYPKRAPHTSGPERGYCGTLATVLADHCAIFAQYLPNR